MKRAVISDFGGVLTTPLSRAFDALERETGVPMRDLGEAMRRSAEADGENPLYELERGRITEAEFAERVSVQIGRERETAPDLSLFGEIFMSALSPNEPMIELMRELGSNGLRMALLTNNVREWSPRWRAMAPVDEIFEVVVDSAYVDRRKPEREIYELTLERVGLEPADCLFVDDVEVNCEAAREIGLEVIRFRDNDQAEREIRAALAP